MEAELSSFGRYCPPPRIHTRTDLQALLKGEVWDSFAEALDEAKAELEESKGGRRKRRAPVKPEEEEGETIQLPTFTKGDDDNDGGEAGEAKGCAPEQSQETVPPPATENPKKKKKDTGPKQDKWFDTSRISAVLGKLDLETFREQYKSSLRTLCEIGNQRRKGDASAMPSQTTPGWFLMLTYISFSTIGSNGITPMMQNLVASALLEKATVACYRSASIKHGASGILRGHFQRALDPHCINTLHTYANQADGATKTQYKWWDSYRAADTTPVRIEAADLLDLERAVTHGSHWSRVGSVLTQVLKLIYSLPHLAIPGQQTIIMPGVVNRSLLLACKVSHFIYRRLLVLISSFLGNRNPDTSKSRARRRQGSEPVVRDSVADA